MGAKIRNKLIASITMLSLGIAGLAGYFTSEAYIFERDTGGHYLGEIEPEIRGVYAHKFKTTPTDNKYTTQKGYSMNILGDIETVWDTYKGTGTTIAVIDDGFDHDHPEYTRSNGTSAISNDSAYFYTSGSSYGVKYYKNDSSCLDEDWDTDENEWATHGTNTSTTAAAPMGNGGGVGIAPEATILALKIDMSFVAIRAAMEYAISKNVDVINMSLGAFAENFTDGFGDSQSGYSSTATYLNAVCQSAYNNGIIVVAAAGNEATWHKSYPACNTKVIGVGALYKNDANTLAPFTNYVGSSQTGEINVDILAPGYVYTAGIEGNSSLSHSTTYHATQGTSFSSPIVAGAACLWKQKNPNGTPDEFLSELQSTAAGIGDYSTKYVPVKTYYGNTYTNQGPSNITQGRLDVGALMLSSKDVTNVTLSSSSLGLYTSGDKHTGELTASIVPANADNKTINWTTSNSSVVSISKASTTSGEKVVITGNNAGSAVITARSNENSNIYATCSVSVETWVPVTGISLLDTSGISSKTIAKRETVQLVPTLIPANASNTDFIVESNNTNIATIDSNYLVKGVGTGTTTIEALIEDDNGDYLSAEYTVTVTAPEGTGTFVVDMYDSSTLSDTSSTTGANLSTFNNKVTLDDVLNNTVLSNYSGTTAYLRKGGLALGTSKKAGSCTFSINSDYPVTCVRVIGTYWDTTGSFTLNGSSGTGSLNANGTVLDLCTEVLTFDNLDGITSLAFSSSKRVVIYQLECDCEVPAGIAVTGVSLSPTAVNLDVYNNQTTTLTATVTPNDATNKAVTWSTSDSEVVTVNNGVLTARGEGSATITVTTKDGSKTATCSVTVTDSTPSGGDPTPVVGSGDFEKVTSTSEVTDGTYLIVCEANNVAFNGGLTTLDANNNTISITPSNDKITANATTEAASFTLTASNGSLRSASGKYIGTTSSANSLAASDTVLTNTITVSSGTATIKSSNNIYLKYNDSASRFRYYSSGQTSIQLYKLHSPLTKVELDETELSLDVFNNSTGSLTATVTKDEEVTPTLSWSSSDVDVALVSGGNTATPTITAVGEGTATITVTATYQTITRTASCTVTVTDSTPINVTGITLDKSELTLNNVNNKTSTLTATYNPANANQLTTTWTTSDSDVVSISSSSGSSITIAAHDSGVAVITATCNGHSASCTVTVDDILVSGITLNVNTYKMFKTDTLTLTATITPAQVTNDTLVWSTSNASIVSISAESGKTITVTGQGNGAETATITVRTTDGSNKSATCTITIVELTSIELQDLPTSVPYKSTFSLGSTKVIASYSDETTKNVTSSSTIDTSAVNTSSLGNKLVTATYTEKGTTKNTSGYVKVTNNGASGNVGNSTQTTNEITATYTFTGSSDTSGTFGSDSLGYSVGNTPLYEENRGLQWSKSTGTITITGITSSSKVKTISVVCSANCSTSVSATLNGSSIGSSQSISSGTANATKTIYNNSTGTNGGTIVITIASGSKSGYIKTITVVYDKTIGVSYPATPTAQAEAWATYFLDSVKGYCVSSGAGSDVDGIASVWTDLASEYGYMTDEAKDAFFANSSGDIAEAKELYTIIYTKYHSSLSNNNFVKDSEDNTMTTNPINLIGVLSKDSGVAIVIMISISSITALGAYLLIHKKKEQ